MASVQDTTNSNPRCMAGERASDGCRAPTCDWRYPTKKVNKPVSVPVHESSVGAGWPVYPWLRAFTSLNHNGSQRADRWSVRKALTQLDIYCWNGKPWQCKLAKARSMKAVGVDNRWRWKIMFLRRLFLSDRLSSTLITSTISRGTRRCWLFFLYYLLFVFPLYFTTI